MTKKESEPLQTKQEVFDVLQFAKKMLGDSPLYGLNVFTPDLVNQAIKQLNMNTLEPSEKNLSDALGKPNENEDNLVAYSEWFQNNSMVYKNMTNYLSNILAFDLKITCSNAMGADYKSKEYKEDLARVHKFLDRLNYQREFRKIIKNMLRQETVFTSFRDESMDYAIQQLPSKYCKITGYTPYTMLFDFNMYYFLTPGVDIDSYAPVFKRYYLDVFQSDGDNKYYPSNSLPDRNGEFVMWHQTSPDENFWCWKFSPEIFTKIPHLAPMMNDIKNNAIVRKLQNSKDLASARALVLGELGFLDNVKSGAQADQLKLSPTTLAVFLQMVKSGLEDAFSIGGVPLENLKKFQYEDNNPNMYAEQVKTTSAQGVSASRLVYADDKMSQAEMILALQTDGNLMKSLYAQFEDFLYFFANKKTRKYKFNFTLEGLNYNEDRSDRLDRALELADRGIVLPQQIQAAMGIKPQEWERMLDEASNGEFTNKLVSLISIHTASGANEATTSKQGRPKKKTGSMRGDSRDYDSSNEV